MYMTGKTKPSIARRALTAARKPFTGPVGPVGPQGVAGPSGPAGEPARYRSPKFAPANEPGKDKLVKPARAHNADAGYDLALTGKRVVLNPGARATVPTGWAVRLDPSTCGLILLRSGNAAKLGLNVITGVVDAGYTGELKVTVHNTSRHKVTLTPGMRIAQMVITPVVNHDAPVHDTGRGVGGFGSTDNTPVGVLGTVSDRERGDMVNHPVHYTVHPVFTGECHDYAKHMIFDQGSVFKYLWRCAGKGDMAENIRKALWYLTAIKNGPVIYRRGIALPSAKVKRLQSEVTRAMDNVDRDKAPTKYMAALACYSAAALIADGKVEECERTAKHALALLDSVK